MSIFVSIASYCDPPLGFTIARDVGESLGVYGLGCARSIGDYAAFSGIDYAARTLEARVFRPQALDR